MEPRSTLKAVPAILVVGVGGFLFLEVLFVALATWPLFLDGTLLTRFFFVASLVAFGGAIVSLSKGKPVTAIALLASQCLALLLANWL